MWDHLRSQEQIEDWQEFLDRPHYSIVDADLFTILGRAAVATGREIGARAATDGLVIEAVPAGWDDASLLAESMAAASSE